MGLGVFPEIKIREIPIIHGWRPTPRPCYKHPTDIRERITDNHLGLEEDSKIICNLLRLLIVLNQAKISDSSVTFRASDYPVRCTSMDPKIDDLH